MEQKEYQIDYPAVRLIKTIHTTPQGLEYRFLGKTRKSFHGTNSPVPVNAGRTDPKNRRRIIGRSLGTVSVYDQKLLETRPLPFDKEQSAGHQNLSRRALSGKLRGNLLVGSLMLHPVREIVRFFSSFFTAPCLQRLSTQQNKPGEAKILDMPLPAVLP